MSSGTLPFQQYHRTCHLGDGTFGSVVKVYSDDGDEYAMKLFLEDHDENEENDDNDDDDDEYTPAQQPMSIGTLRELSCLRVLRGENAHANIIAMVDVQPPQNDDDDNHGAGTSHSMGMTLPLGRYGSLADAISQQRFVLDNNNNNNKSQKVHFTSGLASAIHYLHETWGIAHRDIKSDNILLEYHHPERWVPILIDFSLAKPISTVMWGGNKTRNDSSSSSSNHCTTMLEMEHVPHTGEVGTLIYTAPEVILATEQGFYDPKAIDMYSIGVVLLELIQNRSFTALKYKEARVQIQSALDALPPLSSTNAPFPHLIRQLCATDPVVRLTAVEAVQHKVFTKFGIDPSTLVHSNHRMDIQTALPHDFPSSPAANDENQPPRVSSSSSSHDGKKYERRRRMIDRILEKLDSDHPLTRHAAWDYSRCFEQVDDTLDDENDNGIMATTTSRPSHLQKNHHRPSQSLLDCCLLAYRFYELQVLDLPSAVTQHYPYWDYDDYIDNEMTILMMMDYCLYPRSLAFLIQN